MKNKLLNTTALILSLSLTLACNKKEEDDLTTTPTHVLSVTEVAGSANTVCMPVPAILDNGAYTGKSVRYNLDIATNGNVGFYMNFYETANCTGAASYDYVQTGVIESIAASTSISGATNFKITLGSSLLTPRIASWVTLLNANCSEAGGAPGFVLNSSKNLGVVSCSGGGLWAVQWSASGTELFNSFTLDTSANPNVLRMHISPLDTYGIYRVGLPSGYPNSLTTTFTYY